MLRKQTARLSRAAAGLLLAPALGVRHSMKSLPIPVADARNNFSDIVAQARNGQRIKLTRHGKNVAWIVGSADREALKTRPGARRRKRDTSR
ncbi:MAG TPA: type II toxin-antitoxin system prevent-host-death family antitoxin [Polyangiaceae bacterium]|nr:type II toxin-antitoxin system prevent-host-death family antitoxin [Polyangiaceae bacterium]